MMRDRLVYSTREGRVCPSCGKTIEACVCRRPKSALQGDGVVRVRRETKGRRGKTVTTVSGIPLDATALEALAADLKRRCGSGGSAKDGVIVIQGDHVDLVIEEVRKLGYTVRRAGG